MVKEITYKEFENIEKKGIILLEFFAGWCEVCKKQSPVIAETEKEYNEKLRFLKVDIDKEKEFTKKYSVENIPAQVILKDGEKVEMHIGYKQKENLVAVINKYIK